MAKTSYVILETTVAGIQIVGAADSKEAAEAHLERVRFQWPASSRFEVVEVPMRGRVAVPNAGDYTEADLEKLAQARTVEERKQKMARLAAGVEEL